MKQGRLSIRSVTFTGFAVSALLGLRRDIQQCASGAIVYCQYVDYPRLRSQGRRGAQAASGRARSRSGRNGELTQSWRPVNSHWSR